MKVIVKVSDNHRSAIRLNDVEAYRAITVSDIDILLKRYGDDMQAVIIEEPTAECEPVIKNIIDNYTARIYTFGDIQLEDEKKIPNFTSLSDLQDRLDSDFNASTRTYGNQRYPSLYTEIKNLDGTPYITLAERERLEQERLEAERKAEEERLEQEKLEAERKAEEERLEQEKLEAERKAEEERLEQERLEAERKAEEERLEKERLEAERKAEEERLEKERLEAERKAEEERLEKERLEAERKAEEQSGESSSDNIFAEAEVKQIEEVVNTKADSDSIFASEEVKQSEEAVNTEPGSDNIFAEIEVKQTEEAVNTESDSDDIFAGEEVKKSEEVVNTEPNSDDIFAGEEVKQSEEAINTEPSSDDIFAGEEVKKSEEVVNIEPGSDNTHVIAETKSDVGGEVSSELVDNSVIDTSELGREMESINEEIAKLKSFVAEDKVKFKDLNLASLDSFNSLGDEGKDLVQGMYNEVLLYRSILSSLTTTEATAKYTEELKARPLLFRQQKLVEAQNNNIIGLKKSLSDALEQMKEKDKVSVAPEEIEKIKADADSKIADYEGRIADYEARLSELSESSSGKSAAYEKRIADYEARLSELSEASSEKSAAYEERIAEASKTIAALEEKIESLNSETQLALSEATTNFESELSKLQADIQQLTSTNDSVSKEKEELRKLLSEKVEASLVAMELISGLLSKSRSNAVLSNRESKKLETLKLENQTLVAENLEVKGKLSNSDIEHKRELQVKAGEIRQLNIKLEELVRTNAETKELLGLSEDKVDKLEHQLSTLQIQADASAKQVAEQQKQLEDFLAEIEQKDTDISAKEGLITSKDRLIEELREKLNTQEISEDSMKAKDYAIAELNKTRGEESQANRELQRTNRELEARIGRLGQEKVELQTKVNALSLALKTGEEVVLKCGYSGSGAVIPVFGSGSYGITLSAVSIARNLFQQGHNVLLMDLDLVAPKVNSYLKVAPLLPNETMKIADLKANERFYNTSLGILLKCGYKHFLDNKDQYIVEVAKDRKGHTLDFFSGLIGGMIVSQFQAINWEEVMNTFGNQYDFVIIDLGRYGANPEQNMLINMFTSQTIAFKYLVVTTKDTDDMRLMWTKMSNAKMNTLRCVWMVNMAHDTEETDLMTKIFTRIPHRIVTFNSGLYGTKKAFTDVMFKGQFSGIIDLITGKELK